LLAENRLKADARVGKITFPVALDTNPVLDSAAGGLVFAGGGDVVFCMTGDYAGFAAGAAVQVYY
jgi:hypothetical protein